MKKSTINNKLGKISNKIYLQNKYIRNDKEDREEIKSIDLSNNNNENDNNKNDNSDSDSDKNNSDSDSDKNNNSDDDNNEKEHYIKVSYIIEEMNSLKDELEATRSLLENTNLLVEILNDELMKKHRHIKHLKKELFTGDNNNVDNEDTQKELLKMLLN